MTQAERRIYLINELKKEQRRYRSIQIPMSERDQKDLLRSLMNVREPGPVSEEVLSVQDAYLRKVNASKGIVTFAEMEAYGTDLYLWKGDITRLGVGAIVNAANSRMTGCYQPCHNCIDNCIHTYAGMQLRLDCAQIIEEQGFEEPTGQAKITPAYNLPCDYVIHTVGPIVWDGILTKEHEHLLASCYRSCLELADKHQVPSIAFCCISTGVFMFPNQRAAEIAVETVKHYKKESGSSIKVVFNVFKDLDEALYRELL